jgi:hypothetical protein
MKKDFQWLALSLLLTISIHLLTFHFESTDIDNPIRARLSKPVSLIRSEFISRPAGVPLENCRECLVEDPFRSEEGNACRWSTNYPMYSCRFEGIPIVLIGDKSLGGIEELPMTLVSKALGPLEALRLLKFIAKIIFVFVFYWGLKLFGLPSVLLPFFCLSPMFHGMGQAAACTGQPLYLSMCLAFCFALAASRKKFLVGILTLLFAELIWITSAFSVIPAVAILIFKKNIRRAFLLSVAAGVMLLGRVLVNFFNPVLSQDFRVDMVETPLWVKSASTLVTFLKDLYGMFSLSSVWTDGVPPEFHESSGWLLILQFAVFAMLVFSAGFGDQAKNIRFLIGLFLISAIPIFILGHNNMPTYTDRFQYLFPIAFTAIYLSAGSFGRWIKDKRLSLLPAILVWIVAIGSTADWIQNFRETGPMMTANMDFVSKLTSYLDKKEITAPIMLTETGGIGTFDLYSGEKIRPIYAADVPIQLEPGDGRTYSLLSRWRKFGRGTLLQRNVDYDWLGFTLERSDIERFAKLNGIEIKSIEFFLYRKIRGVEQGFWIVDFVNGRVEL